MACNSQAGLEPAAQAACLLRTSILCVFGATGCEREAVVDGSRNEEERTNGQRTPHDHLHAAKATAGHLPHLSSFDTLMHGPLSPSLPTGKEESNARRRGAINKGDDAMEDLLS